MVKDLNLRMIKVYKNHLLLEPNDGNMPPFFFKLAFIFWDCVLLGSPGWPCVRPSWLLDSLDASIRLLHHCISQFAQGKWQSLGCCGRCHHCTLKLKISLNIPLKALWPLRLISCLPCYLSSAFLPDLILLWPGQCVEVKRIYYLEAQSLLSLYQGWCDSLAFGSMVCKSVTLICEKFIYLRRLYSSVIIIPWRKCSLKFKIQIQRVDV